jgi:hypothetical protein
MTERNKPKRLSKWSYYFNAIIEHRGLIDLEFSGRKFAWSNNQHDPLFEKLDRVLVSPEWEQQYPLVTVKPLVRGVSDHVAFVIDSGIKEPVVFKQFRFELCWFNRPDLVDVVTKVWNDVYEGRNVLDVLQNRKKKLRRVLKGWNLNIESVYKKERKRLSDLLNSIDINSQIAGLSASDYELRISLQYQLNYVLREEEIKWRQRAREIDIK